MVPSFLFDFGVITIFARETLEGGIIIGEYRTVILRSNNWGPEKRSDGVTQKDALRAVTMSAVIAAAVALVVCFAIAIPLAVLSRDFNATTAIVVEGASKIVAAICILQLSLKMPKFFGLYGSKKKNSMVDMKKKGENHPNNDIRVDHHDGQEGNVLAVANGNDAATTNDNDINNGAISIRSIQFNVAWNIWREVAECGVFLIPYFLTGTGVLSIPLSAVIGIVVGAIVCLGIYYANHKLKSTLGLTIFTVTLLMMLSTGLFSGGCHKFEMAYGFTPIIYKLEGDFWDVERLPMTIFKPFGYSDTRTVLQCVCYWVWLAFGLLLHYRKWRLCRHTTTSSSNGSDTNESSSSSSTGKKATDGEDQGTVETPALTALTSKYDDDIEDGMRRGDTSDTLSSTSASSPPSSEEGKEVEYERR